MRIRNTLTLILLLAISIVIQAEEQTESSIETSVEVNAKGDFDSAAGSIQEKLEKSVAELNKLREEMAEEKVPLSRKLSDIEGELSNVRLEYQKTTRLLDSRTLDISNLRSEIKSREQEAAYLSNLLGEYIRNFESRLHITEIQRYTEPLDIAKLAPENTNLSAQKIYEAQTSLLSVSLDHLYDVIGGTRFKGSATDSSGSIHNGTFVLIGPSALFMSDDGKHIGTAEQRLGSLEPTIIEFANIAETEAAAKLFTDSTGFFPLDPTLGNAHKIENTKESFIDHVKKGGLVMIPIFILAGLAILVALFKWLSMLLLRKPSKRSISQLLNAVAEHDEDDIQVKIKKIKGPVGKMLTAGVEHIKQPRELIEEVMYEKVLATRLKLDRFLPFIAISAASAPLLGLLGTVTGIINTFKLITVFGSGDVKTLSGGISEALITTEFGLIVAIPSLLIHAFLSRKAKGVINEMEKAAVAFINQISKTPYNNNDSNILSKLTADQTKGLLQSISGQSQTLPPEQKLSIDSAASIMNQHLISIDKAATVADAIDKIRATGLSKGLDGIYVVDKTGKYVGRILIHQLLTHPEDVIVASLADTNSISVRLNTHKDDVQNLFDKHDLLNIPVLDDENRIVGSISRNGEKVGK